MTWALAGVLTNVESAPPDKSRVAVSALQALLRTVFMEISLPPRNEKKRFLLLKRRTDGYPSLPLKKLRCGLKVAKMQLVSAIASYT